MEQQKKNYGKILDLLLDGLSERVKPKLLLHVCCAPCSSYVMEYLSQYFSIYLLYYNPNISPKEEYERRRSELCRLSVQMPLSQAVVLVPERYDPDCFYQATKGLEHEPEGGKRCIKCYNLRMKEAAVQAKKHHCDYFTTTLTISPMKDANKLNEIGEKLSSKYGVKHLPSDFKKKGGFQRSIQLSKEYQLYRQDYCGCGFSKQHREREKQRGHLLNGERGLEIES